ncbi:hypothetical protein DMUE_1848 [Dictyocoela muelleri]|nr:hypothetical protein DMUE_1848 [Dictyocoela muelleri]
MLFQSKFIFMQRKSRTGERELNPTLSINRDEHFHSNHKEKVVIYKLKEEINKKIVQKPYASTFKIYVGSKNNSEDILLKALLYPDSFHHLILFKPIFIVGKRS